MHIFKRRLRKVLNTARIFNTPLMVLGGICIHLLLTYIYQAPLPALAIVLAVILLGSLDLIKDTISSLMKKQFALDYIAILAITVGLITQQYLVAAVIVLMLSGGHKLEEYGMVMAKKSMTALTDRIPDEVLLYKNDKTTVKTKIELVAVGEKLLIRKGEVIPLDGILESSHAITDESTLTGEPYLMEKTKGDTLRSGTINTGDAIILHVTKSDKDSTYRKIVDMVKQAQTEKAPLIRLADRYSTVFTIITLCIAGMAWYFSQDMTRVLAVLVIATPCPLILATPIALMGGMNAAAHKRIIVKRLSALEVLSRIDAIIFDKTGTITLGRPHVVEFIIHDAMDESRRSNLLSAAGAIERNSLHPLAKAIVHYAKEQHAPIQIAEEIRESVGSGISGTIQGTRYSLVKMQDNQGMAVELRCEEKSVALFRFEDEIKRHTTTIVRKLREMGLEIYIYTGDKLAAAQRVTIHLGKGIIIKAECSPEDKKNGIEELKRQKKVVGMVGDGINDAPALALADVGMVFSNEEHTAASEAADVVFLGGDFSAVMESSLIARRTVRIALESILVGIGLSIIGMIFAAFGYIPSLVGAFGQEAIDILVIFNALRASRQ